MFFQYSSFISYRHDDLDKKYFAKLNNLLKSEIAKATDIKSNFYDIEVIKWGEEWDEKIYFGIEKSIFFLPVWYYHYLSENNIWCARELYHALEIERVIKEQLDPQDKNNFYFIFPLIYRGDTNLFPQSLANKTAKSLVIYESDIINGKDNPRIRKFRNEIYNLLLEYSLVIKKYSHIDFESLFKKIKIPSDAEIIEWVKEQKKIVKEKEAEQLPILTKNAE